jgi:hypothetical protein
MLVGWIIIFLEFLTVFKDWKGKAATPLLRVGYHAR